MITYKILQLYSTYENKTLDKFEIALKNIANLNKLELLKIVQIYT